MVHMISDKLVDLVEHHADEIVKRWMTRLLADELTSSYTSANIQFVQERATNVLKNLGSWLSYETTKEEVGKRYAEEGKALFKLGIPLCEITRATTVLRRVLWLYVVNESGFDSAFQLNQMRELNDRVILFFDRSQYYLTRGYMEEMNRKMKKLWNLTDTDTEKIFFSTSFYDKNP